MSNGDTIFDELYAVIISRKGADPTSSYTASLFAKGRSKIAQKLGEEAIETVLAAVAETPERVIGESADLLYHLMVLWADVGVTPNDVRDELARRSGASGLDEKKSRAKY